MNCLPILVVDVVMYYRLDKSIYFIYGTRPGEDLVEWGVYERNAASGHCYSSSVSTRSAHSFFAASISSFEMFEA